MRQLQPSASFAQVAPHVPEARQGDGQPEAQLGLARVREVGERGAHVVALSLEDREPGCLPLAGQLGLGLLGQLEAPFGVRPPQEIAGAGLAEALGAVLPNRLEQAVPHLTVALLGDDEGCVHEPLEQLKRKLVVSVQAHAPGGRERKAGGEDGQPTEEPLLVRRQELVAPVHRLPERPVAGGAQPPPGDQEAEPVAQAGLRSRRATAPSHGLLRARARAASRRGPSRSGRHSGRSLRPRPAAAVASRARARNSVTASERSSSSAPASSGGRDERRDGIVGLSSEAERLSAGREHTELRTGGEEPLDERRAGSRRCSQLSSTSRSSEVRSSRASTSSHRKLAFLGDVERAGQLPRQQSGFGERREIDKRRRHRGSSGSVRPASSSASRVLPAPPTPVRVTSRERAQQRSELRQLGLAADEAGHRSGQVVPLDRRFRGRDLVAEDRLLEALELLARLEPDLLVQDRSRARVCGERVGLAVGAVEREHQLAPEGFPGTDDPRRASRARRRGRRRARARDRPRRAARRRACGAPGAARPRVAGRPRRRARRTGGRARDPAPRAASRRPAPPHRARGPLPRRARAPRT